MPHIAGHKEGEPILDFTGAFEEEEPQLDFTGAFGIGQGRSEQKFVPENNSIVTMPATSSASFDSRESKELIEGQEGFFGNTSIAELLNAPGGIFDAEDFKKLVGSLQEPIVTTITGGLRERVILGAERETLTPAALADIQSFVSEGITDLVTGDFRSGVSKLFDAFGRARQTGLISGPIEQLSGPFGEVANLAIQANPELAQKFNEKMLELQASNEDFLIRNDLMFGPDDEPTIVGNIMSQIGLTGLGIGGSVLIGNPLFAAFLFGAVQQVSGFQEAEEAGKDPFVAATIGDVQGIIEAGITFLEVAKLTKIIASKSTPIVTKIAAGMLAEGIEEGVTEVLIASVQNLTGVKDMTFEEALLVTFQAVFYGAVAGGGVVGTISTVQRIVGGPSVDGVTPPPLPDGVVQEDIEKLARVMDNVATDEAVEITEQAIADTGVELEISRDIASEKTVTKAAKTKAIQQERVKEILVAINEGRDFNIREALDEINPEAKVQRQKTILEEGRRVGIRTVTKQAIKEEVVRLQTEIQIAEQAGDEAEAARLSERIDQIQQAALTQAAFPDIGIFEAVEELEAEGIFVRGDERLEAAVAEIDNVLRPLRAGVRVGRTLQEAETRALQDSLTAIVDRLGKKPKVGEAVITKAKQASLQRKIRQVNSIASAERIRTEIVSEGRRAAFAKFVSERRKSIDKAIEDNTKPKVAELEADSQNALDFMNKMRLGMNRASGDADAVVDFNIEQSRRIESDMGQGIPTDGVVLQVRYLDILNEKAKVVPQTLAAFEDDLNAFIATGKGVATAATAARQKILDDTKAQLRSNEVKDFRADIVNETVVAWDEVFGWVTKTFQTQVDVLQLGDTPFDLFDPEVASRLEGQNREREINTLLDDVSDGNGKKYKKELEDLTDMVIDIPLEGHAKQFDGTKPKRIRMTRGRLIDAWMKLREESIKKQMTDPNGDMAWTDKFVAMIEQRMTRQDVEFAEGMFEIYRRSYGRFNEVYRRMYNRDLTRVEFYSHIAREGKEGVDASTHNETMFIDMIAPKDRGGTEIFPQEPKEAIERIENASSEIKIGNVLAMHDKYIWDVEHFISHAEPLQLIGELLKDKEFKRRLEDILTPGGFLNFKAHLKVAARTNVGSKKTNILWQKFESLRQKSFKSTLGLNEKIGLGQTATVMAWAPRMSKADLAFGVQDYSLNPKKANARLNKHPTFKNRELNFDPEIEQLDAVGSVFKLTTIAMRKGDAWAVRAGAHADVLSSMKRKGLSEEEALNDAARFAEASQQSTLPSQRTLAQKSDDPLVRTMMMYRSSLVAMFNVSMQSISEYRQADTSTPAKKDTARKKLYETLVTQNVIIPGLYATFTGRPLTATVLVGSSAAIPLLSDLLEVIIGVVMNIFAEEDDRIYFGGPLTVPAGEAFTEVAKTLDNVGAFGKDVVRNGLADAMGEVTMGTFLESIQGIVDVTTGLPMTNAMNKYEAAMKLFETDDPLDAALQMLGFKEEARERMIERLELLTGEEESDTIPTTGAFPR